MALPLLIPAGAAGAAALGGGTLIGGLALRNLLQDNPGVLPQPPQMPTTAFPAGEEPIPRPGPALGTPENPIPGTESTMMRIGSMGPFGRGIPGQAREGPPRGGAIPAPAGGQGVSPQELEELFPLGGGFEEEGPRINRGESGRQSLNAQGILRDLQQSGGQIDPRAQSLFDIAAQPPTAIPRAMPTDALANLTDLIDESVRAPGIEDFLASLQEGRSMNTRRPNPRNRALQQREQGQSRQQQQSRPSRSRSTSDFPRSTR